MVATPRDAGSPLSSGSMRHGSPFAEGGKPDDQGDDGDDLPLRGWLPPDDRLWRHPSELADIAHPAAGAGDSQDSQDDGGIGLGDLGLSEIGLGDLGLDDLGLSDASRAELEGFGAVDDLSVGDLSAGDLSMGDLSVGDHSARARGLGHGHGGHGHRASTMPRSAHRQLPVMLSLVAVVMAVTMVVFVADRLAVTPRTSSALTAEATSLTTEVIPASQVAATVASVRSSLVGLVVTRRDHAEVETGVAMAPGDLVVTSVPAVAGASKIVAITPNGRRVPATLVASDSTSGVSVIRVAGRVTPAHFADSRARAGQLAITECLCQSTAPAKASPVLKPTVAVARVEAVGVGDTDSDSDSSGPAVGSVPVRHRRSVTGGPVVGSDTTATSEPGPPTAPHVPTSGHDAATPVHGLLDAVESDYAPLAPNPWGSVLVNGDGQVAGILASRTETHGKRLDVFVPGWLADTVAALLARDHRVVHGWLGVTGATTPRVCGAVVMSVLPGAPAQKTLAPGDVVTAVDGRSVCNWSELQAALYVISPGRPVDLSVDDAGHEQSITVQLSASPG